MHFLTGVCAIVGGIFTGMELTNTLKIIIIIIIILIIILIMPKIVIVII